VKKTGGVVTVEEHQQNGGMGSAVAELLAQNYPAPMEMVAVDDQFGQSGKGEELLGYYHLTSPWIINAVEKVLEKTKGK
jgi:transketolase